MTGTELVTQFEGLVDDTLDTTLVLQLMNNTKDILEGEREWEYLKSWATLTPTTGQSYTYDLPPDFNYVISFNDNSYLQFPIEKKEDVEGVNNYYYIDYINNTITFGGELSTTPSMCYVKTTPDIEADTSPLFPSRFHSILSYATAKMFFPIDGGEKGRSWDDRWDAILNNMTRAMALWDGKIKAKQNLDYQTIANQSGTGSYKIRQ